MIQITNGSERAAARRGGDGWSRLLNLPHHFRRVARIAQHALQRLLVLVVGISTTAQPIFIGYQDEIVAMAMKDRLPVISDWAPNLAPIASSAKELV